MIRIIKSGIYGKSYQTRCEECGCEFSFERADATWSRPMLSHYIDCTECWHTVYIGDLDKMREDE